MSRQQKITALRLANAWSNFIRLCMVSLRRPLPLREWARPMLLERNNQASRLVETILEKELDKTIINFMRMSSNDFNFLLEQIGPAIQKMDTNMRPSVSAKDKLIVSLRYLATGDQYKSLEYHFRISAQTIGKFIPEVCDCLIEFLGDYVKLPSTSDEWMDIVRGFEDKWNFPHTLGAIDGKHVMIKSPPHSGSDYFNYKKFFSIVLLGVVDSNCNFILISDGGVFRNSLLYKKLERNELDIPNPTPLHESSRIHVPYMFLGDKAFPLTHYCLRPFSGFTERGSVERIFNQRHSIARRPVEMAYGIHSARFRVLRKPIELNEENSKKVVLATIYLHNFLRRTEHARRQDIRQFMSNEVENNVNMRSMDANRSRPSIDMMQIRMHIANFLKHN